MQSVCLGWHWQPYAYTRTADDTDGAPVKPLPADLVELARAAVADTFGGPTADRYAPDAAIVNLYAPAPDSACTRTARSRPTRPVVTISLGDTCVFRLAGVDRRTRPFTDVELRSGDLLVFGGVQPAHLPRRAEGARRHRPADLGLPPGRLSITVRETGL